MAATGPGVLSLSSMVALMLRSKSAVSFCEQDMLAKKMAERNPERFRILPVRQAKERTMVHGRGGDAISTMCSRSILNRKGISGFLYTRGPSTNRRWPEDFLSEGALGSPASSTRNVPEGISA